MAIALNGFDPITLSEMDSVKLMDRTDTKCSFHHAELPSILEELKAHYRVLEVNGYRQIRYESVYFDSADMKLFHNHQCGKLNRYKVRYRRYMESELSFFEIKFKNNKGRTLKSRIRVDANQEVISGHADEFLQSRSPLRGDMLQAKVHIGFKRLTLVNRNSPERVTIDTEIVFSNEMRREMHNLVIAEAKQERARRSEFVELMRRRHIHMGSLSKYCFAVATLHPEIRQNRFKPRLNQIYKLTDDHFTGAGVGANG